jgi:ParB-like chromosome segregation protein Spo0J
MEIKKVKLSKLKPHEENPRTINEFKFKHLVESIQEFPEMLDARPLVVDKDHKILCGNMRYLACKEIGIKELPVKIVDLPEEKKRELMIKDNLSYGDWDWDALDFNWDMDLVDKWLGRDTVDYSALDDYEDLDGALEDLHGGVKKAIQIKVSSEHYEEAKELEKECREGHIYIGGEFLELIRKIKHDEKGKSKGS